MTQHTDGAVKGRSTKSLIPEFNFSEVGVAAYPAIKKERYVYTIQ